jgi:T5SS/PEP-CTERM-associated repeat protein
LAALSASPAWAAVTSTGNVSPAAAATWTASTTGYIGNTAAGTVTVNGGSVLNSSVANIGNSNGVTGTVAIDGFGSTWTNSGSAYIGAGGTGSIALTNGGALSDTVGMMGEFSNSAGTVTVDGPGSKWTSTSNLDVGYYGGGTLDISGGGAVMATSVAVNAMDAPGSSLLEIDVGRGSSLTVGSSTGTMSNNGTVRFVAGASAAAGSVYTPIVAGTWSGSVSGIYQAFGGTWNASSHDFTVSQVVSGAAGAQVSTDLSQKQRMLIAAAGGDNWLGASFLAATSASTISLTASPASSAVLSSLEGQLGGGASVLSAWTLSTSGYTYGNPAYLSLSIGGGYSRSDLDVWGYNGSAWSALSAGDLTLDGTFASFTATAALNGYTYAIADLSPLPGDANGDGRVDVNDLTIVLTNFGQTGMTWSQGEFTGDGTVDINDLTIVLANYGRTAAASAASPAPVPEPGTLILVSSGLLGMMRLTRFSARRVGTDGRRVSS